MKTSSKKELQVCICGTVNPTEAIFCHTCRAILHCDGRETIIAVSGNNATEVQEVSLALLEKTKSSRSSPSPWVSGSFYLIVFMVVIAALSIAGHILPIVAFPLVLIGGLLALSVIGAFQMRQDEKLSFEKFVARTRSLLLVLLLHDSLYL